jgi:predicted nucleotidyltransferase
MSHFNYNKARQFLAEREQHQREMRHQQFLRAQEDAKTIIAFIIEKYKPKRIYQWGSLLKEEHFRGYSDIDIALEGVTNAESFFRLLVEADNLTKFPLDIVCLETIHPLHAESIRKKGIMVYESR